MSLTKDERHLVCILQGRPLPAEFVNEKPPEFDDHDIKALALKIAKKPADFRALTLGGPYSKTFTANVDAALARVAAEERKKK